MNENIDTNKKTTPKTKKRLSKKHITGLMLLAIAAVLLPLVGISSAYNYAQAFVTSVQSQGWWTLPIYCIAAGLAVGLAMVPSHLTSLLAGWLYGLAFGGLTGLLVIGLGASLSFWGSRLLAQDTMRSFLDKYQWTRLLASELIDTSSAKATMAMTLTRLPPQVPFALGNILAASCRVPWRVFLPGTLLGMAPRVLLVAWLGSTLSTWEPGTPIPGALWWALGTSAIGFGGLAIWSGILLKRYKTKTA